MNKLFSSRFMKLAVVLALFVAVASIAYASHSWGNYHWARTGNPFVLSLGDNVPNAWDAYLNEASSDWNPSSVLGTTIVAGGTNNAKGQYTPKNCVPTSGRVEVCGARYGNTGWLGVARIWASGDHIVQGTVKVNDTYFGTAKYNTPAWRRLVMCQEIAHTFGLDHQDEIFDNANVGSCMDYTNDPDGGAGGAVNNDPSNEHPNAHDFAQLETIYAHLDGTTTQSVLGPNNHAVGGGTDGQEIAEWGRSIRTSSDGRMSLFERNLGNGNKIFTFVIWAK